MIEKKSEALTELAPSSRRYPTFRFEQMRDSGRDVLKIKGVKKAFGDNQVLHGVDLLVQRGERVAIMGPNGIGKSTLLKIVMGDLEADEGETEWGYETHPGYFPQDHREQFDPPHNTAEGWVWDFCPAKDIGYVRARMALMLFSGDDSKKRLSALSGGEAARLVFTRLAIARPNVLVLDEPTNHLDLESIEALVEGLKTFAGTLILVSHDRWFVSRLATRIVEIKPDEVRDYHGTYDEYVHFCGDDHLDADRVILKAKTEKRKKKEDGSTRGTGDGKGKRNGRRVEESEGASKARRAELVKRQEVLSNSIEAAEARVSEIDEMFCEPAYYERTAAKDVKALETERSSLQADVAALTAKWERAEEEIG
jgi:ABC-type multidrug transport system ATPase subunit